MTRYIVVFGTVGCGFDHYGPFVSLETASRYAERDGVVVELLIPTREFVEGPKPAEGYVP